MASITFDQDGGAVSAPVPTLRGLDRMSAGLRARVEACAACVPAAEYPGFVRLCPAHVADDLFDRL